MSRIYTFEIGIEGIYLEDYDDLFEAKIELTDEEYDQIRAAYVDYFWDDDDLSELFRDYLPDLNKKICAMAEPFAVAKWGERAYMARGAWYEIQTPKEIEREYARTITKISKRQKNRCGRNAGPMESELNLITNFYDPRYESLKPLRQGDGFRDYLLTEILRKEYLCLESVRIGENNNLEGQAFDIDDAAFWRIVIPPDKDNEKTLPLSTNGYINAVLRFKDAGLDENTRINSDVTWVRCFTPEEAYYYPCDYHAKMCTRPVEYCDGYDDYRLSDVLRHYGYKITDRMCELRFARNELNANVFCSYFFLLAHLSDNQCIVLAPNNYWRCEWRGLNHKPYMPTKEELETPTASWLVRYKDARIRYYIQDGVVKRPVWVSVYDTISKRFFKKDDRGKDRLYYEHSEIEFRCGYEQIPYCTELLEGNLIEPDLVMYDEVVNRLLKSPYIDYAE